MFSLMCQGCNYIHNHIVVISFPRNSVCPLVVMRILYNGPLDLAAMPYPLTIDECSEVSVWSGVVGVVSVWCGVVW